MGKLGKLEKRTSRRNNDSLKDPATNSQQQFTNNCETAECSNNKERQQQEYI